MAGLHTLRSSIDISVIECCSGAGQTTSAGFGVSAKIPHFFGKAPFLWGRGREEHCKDELDFLCSIIISLIEIISIWFVSDQCSTAILS